MRAGDYKNFKVAIYCRAYEVEKMADLEWLEPLWNDLSRQVHVHKIYLETHRDLLIVDEETLEKAIKFFRERGVEVAGGITYTGTETRNRNGNQHLQQYHGYTVFRYFENLKPGQNRGGWVDTGGSNPLDRYAEQLWLTLFARAPEITLFDFRQMIMPHSFRTFIHE